MSEPIHEVVTHVESAGNATPTVDGRVFVSFGNDDKPVIINRHIRWDERDGLWYPTVVREWREES